MSRTMYDMGMTARPFDHMLCFALYGATQAMQHSYKPVLDPLGLTYPQFLVLTALWARDGQTVGTLCATLGLATSTVTPMLKRLESAGVLRRDRDDADERRVRLWLTPPGRAMQRHAAPIADCIAAAIALPSPALEGLTAALHALTDQLRASRSDAQRAASATAGSASSTSASADARNAGVPELPMA